MNGNTCNLPAKLFLKQEATLYIEHSLISHYQNKVTCTNQTSQSKIHIYYRLMHEKRDKSIFRIFSRKKLRKWCYFFTCMLPDYLTHESKKDFWKNIHFGNTRAGFPLRLQNSLRQNTSKMMHFQAWKNKDFIQYLVVVFDLIKIFTH